MNADLTFEMTSVASKTWVFEPKEALDLMELRSKKFNLCHSLEKFHCIAGKAQELHLVLAPTWAAWI